MSTEQSSKRVALLVAGAVLAAGTAAVSVPALANSAKHKGAKTTAAASVKAKSAVKSGTNTPPVPPQVGDGDNDGPGGHGPDGQALKSVLADLVTKGTITQAQSDAIIAALDAKRAADQKAEDSFRTQAAAIVAGVLGITVDQLNADRANHTMPQVTDAQRQEIKTKLDALRTSLGLPVGGPDGQGGPGGPGGDGDNDGPGMGQGMGMGQGGPGMGFGGHHHRGGRGGF